MTAHGAADSEPVEFLSAIRSRNAAVMFIEARPGGTTYRLSASRVGPDTKFPPVADISQSVHCYAVQKGR